MTETYNCNRCNAEFDSPKSLGSHKKYCGVKLFRDRKKLREVVIHENLKPSQAAKELNGSVDSIRRYTKKYSFPYNGFTHPLLNDKGWLQWQYEGKEQKVEDIAESVDRSMPTILRALERFGIERRDHWETHSVNYANYSVNPAGYVFWSAQHKPGACEKVDYVYVHRLLAVAEFGYDAVKDKEVHHKNGVKWDNRPENIEVMSTFQHRSHHAKEMHESGVEGFSNE